MIKKVVETYARIDAAVAAPVVAEAEGAPGRISRPAYSRRRETWLPTSLAYVDQHLGGRHG
jgi:hypothetical protein